MGSTSECVLNPVNNKKALLLSNGTRVPDFEIPRSKREDRIVRSVTLPKTPSKSCRVIMVGEEVKSLDGKKETSGVHVYVFSGVSRYPCLGEEAVPWVRSQDRGWLR